MCYFSVAHTKVSYHITSRFCTEYYVRTTSAKFSPVYPLILDYPFMMVHEIKHLALP